MASLPTSVLAPLTMPQKPARLIVLAAVCIAIAGCEATFNTYGKKALNYPSRWEAPRVLGEQRLCPSLTGTYDDAAIEGSIWVNKDMPKSCRSAQRCTSLSHYLHNEALFLWKGNHVPEIHDWPTATHVQLIQFNDDELEIVTWDSSVDASVKTRKTLNRKDGDFSCDESGLWLRDRTDSWTVILWGAVARESRLFNIANDGTLTMFKDRSVIGNVFLAPQFATNAFWLKWIPSKEMH